MSSAKRFGQQPLHFQEYALLVGMPVTLVGELHRRPDGRLQLQPGPSRAREKSNDMWRTSWERAGCEDKAKNLVHYNKVLVSDRSSLLHKSLEAAAHKHS